MMDALSCCSSVRTRMVCSVSFAQLISEWCPTKSGPPSGAPSGMSANPVAVGRTGRSLRSLSRPPLNASIVIPTPVAHTKRVTDEEVAGVLKTDAPTRYSHFVGQVADWESVWGLRAPDGWVSVSDDSEVPMFPVWPHEIYARLLATGAWANATPTPIEVHEWLASWLPGLTADGSKVAVFPTPQGKGVVVEPARLAADIQDELDRIE